jgi:predicted exporter
MFAAVFLLMPPAITRFAAKARKGHPPALQLSASPVNRRRWAMGLTALLVVLAAGAPLARLENDIKRLYDPNMPSLLMLDELQAATGAYPNRLLARIDTAHPAATLERLNRPHTTFRWLAKANMQSRQDRAAEGTLYITLLPVRNPFDVRNFNAIRNELEQVAKESGASAVALSGDAALSLHLNRLLLRSMGAAAAAVMVILAVILFSLYRSWRETLGPLLVLTMALAGTVGLLAFTGNALSAYTLILLPLLIGIGIDDCFHVLHAARQSGRVETAPHVLAAVTLTTLTTLAGYGSLIAASNKGFVAMGITAISGLSLAWAGSLFILPQFIDLRHHKPPS